MGRLTYAKSPTILIKLGLALTLSFFVTACGYEPLYGAYPRRGTSTTQDLAAITIDPVALDVGKTSERYLSTTTGNDRLTQSIHNHLLDLITPQGKARNPRYRLSLYIIEYRSPSVINSTDNATRILVTMYGTYQLFDIQTNEQIRSRQFRVFTAYNVLLANYANVAAERDARERLGLELAENVRNDLSVWLSRQDKTAAQ